MDRHLFPSSLTPLQPELGLLHVVMTQTYLASLHAFCIPLHTVQEPEQMEVGE